MSGKRRVYFTEEPQQNYTQPPVQQQPFVPSPTQSGPVPTQPTYMQPAVPLQPYQPTAPFQPPLQPGNTQPFPQPTYPTQPVQPATPPPPSEPPTQTAPQADHGHVPVKHKRVMAIDPEDLSHYESNPSGSVNQLANQVGQMSMNPQGVPMQPFTPGGQSVPFGQQLPPQGQLKPQGMPMQSSQGEAIPLSIAPQIQCPPTYLRMTTNVFPNTSNLLTKSNIPLGCIIHPMAQPVTADDRIPVVNFGISGIVRCRKCRSYINPFVAFLEGGRRWKCNLCSLVNDVPGEYYSPTDSSGRRADLAERPELSRGCVEFIAPSEYMVRPPQPPSYFFLIDVSYYSITSGAFYVIVDTIKKTLNEFPGSPRTKIGFITFDSSVHFYNLKSGLTQPQMLVVNDIADMFVPSHPDDLMVNLSESKTVVETLLTKLPNMFQGTQNVDNAFGVALKAAFEIIKPIGGKIICFLSNIPTAGIGKLTNREDLKLLGTDKEVQLLNPEDQYYKNFALDCSRLQISIDLFLTASQFMDVATLGTMPQFTGGQLYYYPAFKAERDGEKLFREIRTNITRETGFEAVMRVRTSKGIKVTAHYGNFFIRSTDLLALPNIDSEKAFGVQFNFAESNLTTKYVSIQAALLYTTSSGERRIRVFTQCLPVTSSLGDMFTSADVDAISTLTGKMALDKALSSKLPDAREALVNKCIDILTVYKTDLATNTSGTQLMLPETLKLLPLYILGLLKSIAFRAATDIRPDERVFFMSVLRTLPVALTIPFAYPRLYALHNLPEGVGSVGPDGAIVLPPLVNLSSERLERHGVFLLEDGQNAYLWLGRQVSPDFMLNVFGIPIEHVDPNTVRLPRLENEYSIRVNNIVDSVIAQRPTFMTLQIIKEGDAREYKFLQYLVEDKTKTVHSYYEFLVNLHQRIQAKITKNILVNLNKKRMNDHPIKKLTLEDQPAHPPCKIIPKPLLLLADSQSLFCVDKEGVGAHPLLCGVTEVLRKEKSSFGLKAAYVGALNSDMPEIYDLFLSMFECINPIETRHIKQNISEEDKDFIDKCDMIVISGGDIQAGRTSIDSSNHAGAAAFSSNGLNRIIPRKYQDGTLIIGISEGAVILSECIWQLSETNPHHLFRLTKNIMIGVREDKNEWKAFKLKHQNLKDSNLRAIALPRSSGLILYDTSTAPSIVEDEEQKKLIAKHSQIPGFRRGAPTQETVSGPWLVKAVFHYALEFNLQGEGKKIVETDPSLYYRMDILSFPELSKEDDPEIGIPKQYVLKPTAQPHTKKEMLFVGPFVVHSVTEHYNPTIEAKGSLLSLVDNADIIPGTYEGGFHIWDCGMDLVNFMEQIGYFFKGAKVLELGCGYGIPGICAYRLGASVVDFQDYNYEVISTITSQNVLLNLAEGNPNVNGEFVNSKSRFFSGDWGLLFNGLVPQSSMQKEGDACKYKIVITSDTVYQQRCHKRLHDLLEYVLHPKGVAVLAGKKMYGPGGGIKQFVRYVNSRGVFEATRVTKRSVGKDGQGNSRWVVVLSFKGQDMKLDIAPARLIQQ